MDLTPKRDSNNARSPLAAYAKRFPRNATLLAALIVAVLAGWLWDAPGLWLRTLAERSLGRNDPHNALSWVAWAVWHAPQDPDARLLGARANLQLNRNSAALELVDQAALLGAPADQLEPYRWMIAAQRGEADAAEQLLNQSDRIPLPPEAYEAIIRCAQYQEQLPRAELMLERLEATGHATAVVAYHRGRNLEIAEDYAAAADFYGKAFQTQPRMVRSAFRAGSCFYALRSFERAAEMFRQAQNSAYKAIASVELANALWEQKKFEEASQTIAPYLDDDPVELQTLYLQVDEYIDSDRAALIGARIQDALGNSQAAVNLLERVLAYNHRDFEARALLIKNLRQLQREPEANALAQVQSEMIAKRQRARQLRLELIEEPNNIDKLCELAQLYWEAESVAEAQLAISQILERDRNCECAKQLRAKINAEENNRAKRHAQAPAAR